MKKVNARTHINRLAEQSSIRHCLAMSLWKTATTAPAPTMFALASGKHQELLKAVLHDAKQLYPEHDEDLDISNVAVQLRRIVDRPTALIRLPPPFKCPDPHFIALVLDKPLRGDIRKSDLEGGKLDFFTLEAPPDESGNSPPMFCSRDPDGTHHNHGATPHSDADAFCDRLRQMYRRKPWWRSWCVLIVLGLAFVGPIIAAGPEAGKKVEERVLFYLHGKIIEDQGLDAVSDRFGRYEYEAILESLARDGHRIISEVRGPDTDVWEYAKQVAGQIEELKRTGLPSDHVTVLGASKGAFITVLVSHLVRDADINYVLLATCSPQVLETWQEQDVCISGDVLAIQETPDAFAGSCATLAERCDSAISRFEEIELRLGVDHGVCYRPYDEWVAPTLEWAR